MCQAVSMPTPSSAPKGPIGIFMIAMHARSTSSTVATSLATRVIAALFIAVYTALKT